MRTIVFLLVLLALTALFGACGDDDPPTAAEPGGGIGDTPLGEVAFFGADETVCESTVLANEVDDEARVREAGQCFLDAVDAATPLVWDVSVPTVEGDPIYHRFHYTGDDVLIVVDSRADTFGSGAVDARWCASVRRDSGGWLPVGEDCVGVDHPGFADAEPG